VYRAAEGISTLSKDGEKYEHSSPVIEGYRISLVLLLSRLYRFLGSYVEQSTWKLLVAVEANCNGIL